MFSEYWLIMQAYHSTNLEVMPINLISTLKQNHAIKLLRSTEEQCILCFWAISKQIY